MINSGYEGKLLTEQTFVGSSGENTSGRDVEGNKCREVKFPRVKMSL